MTETVRTPPYTLGSDEKAASIMVYTANYLYWGEVVIKEKIRVSTWLRTNSAPERICIYNAKAISTLLSTPPKPILFNELLISTSQVLAYHLVPPITDPPDYDPSEPNRRMVPVSMIVGAFRMDGSLRLSASLTVAKYLEVAHDPFAGIYDAQIASMTMTTLGIINIPFLLVRQETTVFTV